jgi:predicted dehydrogenase
MDMGCYPLHWVSQMTGTAITDADVSAVVAGSGVDESMQAKLTFGDGAIANISCSMHPDTPFGASMEITGRDGKITFENPLVPHQGGALTKTVAGQTEDAAVSTVTTYCYQLQAIRDAFRSGKHLPTEGAGLLTQQASIDQLYDKAGLGHLRRVAG